MATLIDRASHEITFRPRRVEVWGEVIEVKQRANKAFVVVRDREQSVAIEAAFETPPRIEDYIRLSGLCFLKRAGDVLRIEIRDAQLEESRGPSFRSKARDQELRRLKGARPAKLPWHGGLRRLTLVTGKTSKARADFLKAFGSPRIDLHETTIRIDSAEQIAAAIESAESDLVVVVRGGGSPLDFLVFDDPRVLNSVASQQIPVLIGVGHAPDRIVGRSLYAKVVATPTAAGQFVRRLVSSRGPSKPMLNGPRNEDAKSAVVEPIAPQRQSTEDSRSNGSAFGLVFLVAFALGLLVGLAVNKGCQTTHDETSRASETGPRSDTLVVAQRDWRTRPIGASVPPWKPTERSARYHSWAEEPKTFES